MKLRKLLAWALALSLTFGLAPNLSFAQSVSVSYEETQNAAGTILAEEADGEEDATPAEEQGDVSALLDGTVDTEEDSADHADDTNGTVDIVGDAASDSMNETADSFEDNGTIADADSSEDDGTIADADSSEDDGTIADDGSSEDAASSLMEDPYMSYDLAAAYAQNLVTLPESWTDVSVTYDDTAKGLMITGSSEQLASGKIELAEEFNFDGNAVGRISMDGLSPKTNNIDVEVYLDDAEEPAATIQLHKQKKKSSWAYTYPLCADVLTQNITGQHKVSLRIVPEKESDEVSLLIRSVEFAESSIPVIYFDIDESCGTIAEMNNDENHETECYGSMTVQIPDGYVSEYTDEPLETATYEMEYIRGRGNSTWSEDKKPYKIKLEKKADLFGMGKNKHWVLLANRLDNSNLRNKITYWVGDKLNLQFTPQSVAVEVVMNGEYLGSYFLSEHIRVGDSRVEIDDLEDEKEATDPLIISGGYLLSVGPWEIEGKAFMTEHSNTTFQIESPSFEDYENETQYNYIKDYVQKVEDAIYGDNFELDDGTSYKDLMDIDSTIDYWWVQEFTMNGDGFDSGSTYLYKVRDGKLYWGPLWDFDYVAWSSWNYDSDESYAEFAHRNSMWFDRLFQDKEFAEKVVERWPYIREQMLKLTEEGGVLDEYASSIRTSMKYDVEKWGMYDFGQASFDENYQVMTFDQEVERLRTWINNRVNWLDEHVSELIPIECTLTFVDRGKTVKTLKTTSGSYIETLPELSDRKGYVFGGWSYYEDEDWEVQGARSLYVEHDLTLTAYWVKESEIVPVTDIYFRNTKLALPIYDVYAIEYEIYPWDATVGGVTWTTSDASIATVNQNGEITPVSSGNVTITAKAKYGSAKKSLKVRIYGEDEDIPYFADSISLNKHSITMEVGEWIQLYPVYSPAYVNWAWDYDYWLNTEDSVAGVDSLGVVEAYDVGTTTVLYLDTDTGVYDKCKITVKKATKKGDTFTKDGLKYKVTSVKTGKKTVTIIGRDSSKKTAITIPDTVTRNNVTYKVTAIGASAFKGTSVKSVKIGKNVTKIGASAFAGCSKLAAVRFAGTKIKTIGEKAFSGIKSSAVFKVPKSKLAAYKKLLTGKNGYKKTMKVKGV